MAWKEYSQLSLEDKQHEDKRQRMIVRQNCIGHATQIVLSNKGPIDTTKIVSSIVEISSELERWVYQDEKPVDNVSDNLPLPTPSQSKILEKFENTYKIDRQTVFKIYGRYPNSVTEAAEALKEIQEVYNGD